MNKAVRWLYQSRILRWFVFGTFSIVFGLASAIGLVLAHDSLTYRHRDLQKISPSELALHPEPGGPKNLPVVSDYVEGDEDNFTRECKGKERLVIVGGGWAAVSLLSKLEPGRYNVTLVSPNNFYLL
jgi:NADH dehydrogenase